MADLREPLPQDSIVVNERVPLIGSPEPRGVGVPGNLHWREMPHTEFDLVVREKCRLSIEDHGSTLATLDRLPGPASLIAFTL